MTVSRCSRPPSASTSSGVSWTTASPPKPPARAGAQAVCTFVNDRLDRPCLEALACLNVKHVALRCAGFNSIDLIAAKEFGFSVTRVPAYSPYAVAEHAVALLLRLIAKSRGPTTVCGILISRLTAWSVLTFMARPPALSARAKFGRVAAQILRGFGMRVLAFDLFPVGNGHNGMASNTLTPARWRASVKSSRFTRRLRRRRTTSSVAKHSN